MRDAITDVPGIKVGHWSDRRRATGCTVVLAEEGASAGVHVAGGAPGTLNTDLLRPENTVPGLNAVLLTGGSAFGLDAAAGIRGLLLERGYGYRVRGGVPPVPIVSGAVVFDLGVGAADAYPTAESGRRAAERATSGKVEQGSVGVGTGCTVAKLDGMEHALKGGVGTASMAHSSGLVVGAIVAVNSLGDIYDVESGALVAGPRGKRRGEMGRAADLLLERPLQDYLAEAEGGWRTFASPADPLTNTTLAVVATNARLDKAEATRLAIMANDGIALAVRPAHTPGDGDAVFALATGRMDLEAGAVPGLMALLGSMAATCVSRAIVGAVREAVGLAGVPSVGEWGG